MGMEADAKEEGMDTQIADNKDLENVEDISVSNQSTSKPTTPQL